MIERTHNFIELCSKWKDGLCEQNGSFDAMVSQAQYENPWFIQREIQRSLHAICDDYLDAGLLHKWLSRYPIEEGAKRRSVGIIAAGNIPFVVFHDLLCALAADFEVYIKLSDKDKALPTYCLELLTKLDTKQICKFQIVSKLPNVDKYIITGSSLTKTHFQSYLKDKPALIRGHRNSVAICSGLESEEQWLDLGTDVFSYFGLGCRNVTKLFIPSQFNVTRLLELWDQNFSYLEMVVPYMRNLEYQRAVKLLNKIPFLESTFLHLENSSGFSPPITTLYYEKYDDVRNVIQIIRNHKDHIQCVCTSQIYEGLNSVPFGKSQRPTLSDYQDQKDTLLFLLQHDETGTS